jgi:hypothetical protein
VDNLNWHFERDAEGRNVVKHHAPPRFVAHWTSGTGEETTPPVPCWKHAGSGDGGDSLHIYGFQWIDRRPGFEDFDRIMREAATAIDAWIASRL